MIFDNNKNSYVSLERKVFVRYLGILIDQRLTWNHHIEDVTKSRNGEGGTGNRNLGTSLQR